MLKIFGTIQSMIPISRLVLLIVTAYMFLSTNMAFCASQNLNGSDKYHLKTLEDIQKYTVEEVGEAWIVNKEQFPAIEGVTCFTLELWEDSMRLPHWHPNSSELGYVVSGMIEILIWRSPGETALSRLGPGMCWFIPQGALHSLNNIGPDKAQLLVGFSTETSQDMDLPVAFNGLPPSIREAYTSPHSQLKNWTGPTINPLIGKYQPDPGYLTTKTASPYQIDLAQVPPLFNSPNMGSVVWAIKDNWNILEDMSLLRAHLKPGTARDAIWYPDVGTLYIVSQGSGQFHVLIPDEKPHVINAKLFDYVYVPVGILHTFINTSPNEDFEVIALFTKANPLPEVSLSVATSFFPKGMLQNAMTEYGSVRRTGDPLKDLQVKKTSPYLIQLPKKLPE